MHNQLLVVVLLIAFESSAANSLCAIKTCYDETETSNCWILFQIFKENLVNQSSNLNNLNQIFFPTSRIPPVIVNVTYNVQIHVCGINHKQVLGWTSKSLYNNFDGEIINQIPLQVPYLVLILLECLSGLERQPYVDDFLWAGGQRKLPEVHITLNVSIHQSLEFTLLEYDNFNCPSNETIKHALTVLNQWVSLELIFAYSCSYLHASIIVITNSMC